MRSVQSVNNNFYEVIVTDDSKDNVAKKFIETNYLWVKWVEGPKKGPAANRNNGANHAAGEWLIFIDDDCVPDEKFLNAYKKAITVFPDVEVFEGRISVDRTKQSFIEESPVNENGGFLWSCNFMIKANLFKELDGFDPAFPYAAMEDVDLQYRIKKMNRHIEFIKEARVIHPWRIEKDILGKTKKRFQSTLYFLKKHPEMMSKLNAVYFSRAAIINFKNAFKYAYKFRLKGIDKQIVISILHMYFAIFLFFKKSFY